MRIVEALQRRVDFAVARMRGHGVEIEAHEVTARQRDEIRAEARKIARCAREYHKIERVRGSAMRADDGRANESQLRARVSVNIGGYMGPRRGGDWSRVNRYGRTPGSLALIS